METGEYETNTFLINNVASVAFRVYEPSADQSQSFRLAALEIEGALRDQGHTVSYDANRRGIWLFQVNSKDETAETVTRLPDATLETCGHSLAMAEEGTFEPLSLQKNRAVSSAQLNTPTSSSSNGQVPDPSQRNSFASPQGSMQGSMQDGDSRGQAASAADPKPGQTALKIVYEQFITAILSAISFTFCSQSMAVPLNYRTVLIPPPSAQQDEEGDTTKTDPVLGTFRTYMTTTGSLIISMYFSYCKSLSSLEDVVSANLMSPNRHILAAPFGVLAMKQGYPNGETTTATDTGLAQTPNTQALSFKGIGDSHDSQWKQKCIKALELCGLDVSSLKSGSWVNLMVSRRAIQDTDNETKRALATVPWPGSLCFRKKPVEVSATCRIGDNMLSGHEECHDPLGNARGWFNSTSERDEKVARRKADRVAAISKEANGSEPQAQRPNGQSPLALRRPSTAAAGVMYPTPPDAIQQQVGVTPSFDGTTSSPGNQLPAVTVAEVDSAMPIANPVNDSYNEGWDGNNQQKRDRSDSNLLGDSDNIFGEMGGDMFGDHNVTEDDFNFFDEPGDVDLDLSMADIQVELQPPAPPVITQAPPINPEPPKVVEVEEEPPPKPKPDIDDAVFAKPELKHARSSLNDETSQRGRTERSVSAKRESSPFDPDTVFKRVRASLLVSVDDRNITSLRQRKKGIFQRVDFDPKLPMINKKYEQGGTYDFMTERDAEKSRRDSGTLKENKFSERHGKPNKKLKDISLPVGSMMKFAGIEPPSSQHSPTKLDSSGLGADDSDVESDDDQSSSQSEGPMSPVKSSVKRAIIDDDDVVSQVTSIKEMETSDEPTDEQLTIELPKLSKPEPPEISLYRFFSDPEPLTLDLGVTDQDLIQVAQLITEQAATGFIGIGLDNELETKASLTTTKGQELFVARNSLQILQGIIPTRFGGAMPIRLKGYLDVADVPMMGQPNRMQPRVQGRDPNSEQLRANNLYPIPSPHLEVRRSDTKLSVLPSAVTFWESLGLAPSSGTKDIVALCVFPGWKGMSDHAATFLGRLKGVYESLKLGTFGNLEVPGHLGDGILSYEVDRISTSPDATITVHGSGLSESMETLQSALSDWDAKYKNLVIYFVYSPDNPGSILESCSAFQRCFDVYNKTLQGRKESPQNELVLQLVPSDFVSSTTCLAVPSPTELAKLCIETYDRCTLFLSPEFGGPTPAPAIMLEQPLPRMIDFKLANAPSASLMHENSCIHVAYATSIDERWVTAAWTDNRGQQQATASYCLGRKGKPLSNTMNEVAHEIWESTLDLISIWKVHWRIIITKSGPMDVAEMEFWADLARTESKATVNMMLMTVDTNPSLQLIPPIVKVPQAATSTFYSTPVSTPQASILSPEQTTTPATPMRDANAAAATPGADSTGEVDADSFLIDATDQTWGAVAGHRLSNSTTLLELRPALVSGYLIKRTGNKVEDPPVVMEVNLVHTEATPRAYEPLLREMLSYFRGLGTLARARGVVDRENDVRPWHIAAAEKGVRALYLLL